MSKAVCNPLNHQDDFLLVSQLSKVSPMFPTEGHITTIYNNYLNTCIYSNGAHSEVSGDHFQEAQLTSLRELVYGEICFRIGR